MGLFKSAATKAAEREDDEAAARAAGYLVVNVMGPVSIRDSIQRRFAGGWVLERVVYGSLVDNNAGVKNITATLVFRWPATS